MYEYIVYLYIKIAHNCTELLARSLGCLKRAQMPIDNRQSTISAAYNFYNWNN